MPAMLTSGDLVKVKDYAFKYFANKTGLIEQVVHREEYLDEDGKLQERTYYLVDLDNPHGVHASHIFPDDHLILLSKAGKEND